MAHGSGERPRPQRSLRRSRRRRGRRRCIGRRKHAWPLRRGILATRSGAPLISLCDPPRPILRPDHPSASYLRLHSPTALPGASRFAWTLRSSVLLILGSRRCRCPHDRTGGPSAPRRATRRKAEGDGVPAAGIGGTRPSMAGESEGGAMKWIRDLLVRQPAAWDGCWSCGAAAAAAAAHRFPCVRERAEEEDTFDIQNKKEKKRLSILPNGGTGRK